MYKFCKTAQSAERQRHIVNCLLDALRTRPYAQITVQELCLKAGVPRKSFYRYFECKQDVLLAAIDFYVQDYESFTTPDTVPGAPRTTQKELERFFAYTRLHKETFEALTRNDLLGYAVHLMTESAQVGHIARRLMTRSDNEASFHIKNIFISFGIYSVVANWVATGCRESVSEMARILTEVLTEPLYHTLDASNQ